MNNRLKGGGVKRITSVVLTIILLISISDLSWAKKQKTGKVKDHTFFDSKFAYELSFLKNWKLKDEKEPSLLRASLVKKNYRVDPLSKSSREEFNIPTILVFADTSSLSFEEFKNALFDENTRKIKNRDKYAVALEFLTGSEIMKESEILVDSIPAKIITMRKPFERMVEDPTKTRSPMGSLRIINDFLLGYLLFFKHNKNIFVIHFSCERQFFGVNHEEFIKIMDGWRFKER